MEEFNNKIVILNDYAKKSFIKKIDKLINVKVITLSELKRKYYFDYDNKAIYFVSNKYNCIPEIAKIYIENTYFISRMTDSISLVGIQNTLSETELKSFNEKCTKLNIIERRNKNTFLDYAFRLEKYILEDDDCKTILPDTNIIPKNDRGFLTCMILLANNNVITNEMAVDFDIIDILAIS